MRARGSTASFLRFNRVHRGWSRFLHLACLVGWLFSSEGIGPFICASLAPFDGGHEVVVANHGGGVTTVTLVHPRECAADDEHGLLTRTLLMLGKASDDSSSDHVLSFQSLDDGRMRLHLLAAEQPVAQVQHYALSEGARFHLLETTRGTPARGAVLDGFRVSPRQAATGGRVMLC